MLSVNTEIEEDDIVTIKLLDQEKGNVFLLVGKGPSEKVVLKLDVGQSVTTIKSANPIVKAIAPNAALKILKPQEVLAIQEAAWVFENDNEWFEEQGVVPDDRPTPKTLRDLKAALKKAREQNVPLLKMAFVRVTDLKEALTERLEGNKTSLKAFTATLNAKGGLERLGQIIAVDLFTTNFDRFWPAEEKQKVYIFMSSGDIRPLEVPCQCNASNVFRIVTEMGSEVGALDFVFPTDGYGDINTPLKQARLANKDFRVGRGFKNDTGQEWSGRILENPAKRHAFAKDVAQCLEALLHPQRKTKNYFNRKLSFDAAKRIEKGMIQGAQRIADKLKDKYGANGMTQGVKERYTVMRMVR